MMIMGFVRVRGLQVAGSLAVVVASLALSATASASPVTVSSGLSEPGALAVDGQGDVFIANGTSVLEVTPAQGGGYNGPTTIFSKLTNAPNGLGLDGDGDLFILEPSGSSGEVLEATPAQNGGFNSPTVILSGLVDVDGLAVDPNGDVFVSQDVETVGLFGVPSPRGTVVEAWPGQGDSYRGTEQIFSGLTDPAGVAVDDEGDVFVADGAGEVWGASEDELPTPVITGLPGPIAVAPGEDGSLFIAEFGDGPAGAKVVEAPAAQGGGYGALETILTAEEPVGLAVDDAGLFILDAGAGDVIELPAPVDSTAPAISNAAVEGSTLKASTGTWSGSPTSYGYQWYDCDPATAGSVGQDCNPISGATDSTYTVGPDDAGESLEVAVAGLDDGFSGTPVDSTVTAPVEAAISSPSNIGFGALAENEPSPVSWLEVTNSGGAPLAFTSPATIATGVHADDFTIPTGDDLCNGETLAPGQICWIGVQFTPSSTSTETGTLDFGDNDADPQPGTIALSGQGVAPARA